MLTAQLYRGVKPPPGVGIDPFHPLARGLRGFWLMNEIGVPMDRVRRVPTHPVAQPSWVAAPDGRAVSLNGSTQWILTYVGAADAADAFTQMDTPITIASRALITTISATSKILYTTDDSNAATYFGAWLGIFNNQVTLQYGDGLGGGSSHRRSKSSSLTVTANTWSTIAGTIRGATDMSLYLNGVEAGGSYGGTATGVLTYSGTKGGAIGAPTVSTNAWPGQVSWVGLWARNLTDAEHMQLHINPFEMFTSRKIVVPLALVAPSSFIKTIMGVSYPTNVKTIDGLSQASVKTVDGLA